MMQNMAEMSEKNKVKRQMDLTKQVKPFTFRASAEVEAKKKAKAESDEQAKVLTRSIDFEPEEKVEWWMKRPLPKKDPKYNPAKRKTKPGEVSMKFGYMCVHLK
jgi:hypothetical protein